MHRHLFLTVAALPGTGEKCLFPKGAVLPDSGEPCLFPTVAALLDTGERCLQSPVALHTPGTYSYVSSGARRSPDSTVCHRTVAALTWVLSVN